MAYYVMEEMPDIHKTGERVLYPRFAMIDQVSTEQLARNVSESSGFNVGDIIGIVKQLAIEMSIRWQRDVPLNWMTSELSLRL